MPKKNRGLILFNLQIHVDGELFLVDIDAGVKLHGCEFLRLVPIGTGCVVSWCAVAVVCECHLQKQHGPLAASDSHRQPVTASDRQAAECKCRGQQTPTTRFIGCASAA